MFRRRFLSLPLVIGAVVIGVVSGKAIFGPPLDEYWAKKLQEEASAKETDAGSRHDRVYAPPVEAFPYKVAWEPNIPTNVKFFIWSLLWERILTIDNLNARGTYNVCALCNCSPESINHLLLLCPISVVVWNDCVGHIPRMGGVMKFSNPKILLSEWPKLNNRGMAEACWAILPYTIMWVVWSVRNEIIFAGAVLDTGQLLQRVKRTLWAWLDVVCKAVDVKKGFTVSDLLLRWDSIVVDSW
ncbi:hypothetical protein FRX31_029996 [Thalictrum thalictroides]|uniref:Reverse transcriptase zinc-binding domain-containing protein n=1 Tax=Thalictrum thalictroides TaxID=46969 RepID=A0A7J6V5Q5_THATH|nr:hypothetical protein FRX31_029996 [Thalictrum thalictroides]